MLFYLEYVTEALATYNVAGIRADFLAEASDVDVDGAVGNDDILPDTVHELLPGENLTSTGEKQTEQVELGAGEAGGLAVDGDGFAVEVHL